MPAPDIPYLWQLPPRPRGVDDAYSAWSNAHRRCTDALRAWEAAASGDRAAAYQMYVVALGVEEIAAADLAREHALRTARHAA